MQVTTTPLNLEAPANSPGNTDQGFMKKLKEFDGLAMSISNNKAGSAEHSSGPRNSQRFVMRLGDVIFHSLIESYTMFGFSFSSENDDSSNGSDGNTTGVWTPPFFFSLH